MNTLPDSGWLRGIHVALPTPFSEDGTRVLGERLGALVRRLAGAGIEIFLPAAANGEFHSLSVDETVECVRITRDAIGSRGTVVAPIGFDRDRASALGRRAIEAGADALLYMPPTHPYLWDAGMETLIRELAGTLDAPLMLYRKGPVPSDALLARLVREGLLAGVKYTGSDPEAVSRFVREIGGRDAVICGAGERYAPFFSLAGAGGYSSGAANVAPRVSLSLLGALARGDHAGAMQVLEILRPLEDFRARDGDSCNICALKHALSMTGLDFGLPRPPQRRLAPGEKRELENIVSDLLAAEERMGDVASAASTGGGDRARA